MEIRNATELDKEEFSQLYQKLYSPEGTKPPPQDSLPIENPAFFNLPMVAVEQDTIVGFIWGYVVDFGLKRYGYVEDLYVDEGWRTQGVGGLLLDALKEQFTCLKTDAVFVTTDKDNHEAIALYLKAGFEKCPGPWFYWTP